jgi:prepilin-type processing-associated H-X9-DG protein
MGYDWSYAYWGVMIDPKWVADPADSAALFTYLHGGYGSGMGCYEYLYKDGSVALPTYGQTVTLHHLRDGLERFLITDINNPAGSAKAQSEILTMWDTIRTHADGSVHTNDFSHLPGGANVLFMDGHVSFAKYPQAEGTTLWIVTRNILNDGVEYSP